MPILICQQCGRMFEVAPRREHSARYCSKECQLAATQKKETKCECCGKEFNPLNRKNPRFCSRICASAAQSGLSREAYLAKKSADKADPREGKHLCVGVAGKSCGRWITDYRCPQCWEKLRKGSDAEGLPSYEFHERRSGGREWDWKGRAPAFPVGFTVMGAASCASQIGRKNTESQRGRLEMGSSKT